MTVCVAILSNYLLVFVIIIHSIINNFFVNQVLMGLMWVD